MLLSKSFLHVGEQSRPGPCLDSIPCPVGALALLLALFSGDGGVSKQYHFLGFIQPCRPRTCGPPDPPGCGLESDVGHLAAPFKAQRGPYALQPIPAWPAPPESAWERHDPHRGPPAPAHRLRLPGGSLHRQGLRPLPAVPDCLDTPCRPRRHPTPRVVLRYPDICDPVMATPCPPQRLGGERHPREEGPRGGRSHCLGDPPGKRFHAVHGQDFRPQPVDEVRIPGSDEHSWWGHELQRLGGGDHETLQARRGAAPHSAGARARGSRGKILSVLSADIGIDPG